MKRILLISIALAVLLGVACEDEAGSTFCATSPAECIQYLEQAFNDRDIAIFETQIAPDFIFYFNEDDVGEEVNGYTIPETWDYEHEHRAVWNIVRPYAEGGVYDISMQLPENDIGTPPEGATEYTVDTIGISLLVMFDTSNGAIANMGTLGFTFVKTNDGGTDYWRIKEWRDFTYVKGEKTLEYMSLGGVKAYFYALDPLPE